MDFTLNGTAVSMEVREGATMLELLREGCGVTSVKDGCAPEGSCGACTVLVDGKAVVSCAQPASRAAGKTITTQEGLPSDERRLWADCFMASGASQCGFCSPGIVMKAESLLSKNTEPSRDEIARALAGNLCRCTGYVKIVDAVQYAAGAKRGEAIPVPDLSGRVGSRTARYQGRELALGDKPYINDMKPPGMLHGSIRFSDHPRARVTRIDSTKAESHPGVVAVVTWKDVPGERTQGLITRDWRQFVAQGEITSYVGDVLVAIAAETRVAAREAAELVEVVDEALASAAHVATETFRTQFVEHAFLEPESSLAVPDPEEGVLVHIYSQGQGVWEDRKQVASFLGMPQEKVRVTQVSNGGAFGAKEDLNVQCHSALLALKTGRPVLTTLSRKESMRFHSKRHPITMEYTVGCDEEGRLVAVRARMVGDTGAYSSVGDKVLERAAGHACSVYSVPNVDVEARAVYTNNPPAGAMRGFGANQANFAIEGMMDILADQVGIDGWEIRWRNAVEAGDRFGTGQILGPGVGADRVTVVVDTSRELDTGQTTASRSTVLGGRAIIEAAGKLKGALNGGRLEDLAGQEFYGEIKIDWTHKPGHCPDGAATHFAYGWATQVAILDEEGRMEKVVAAHDVGKVINPTLLEGQIEGAVHMGLGHALSEEFVVEGGIPVTETLKSLNIIPPRGMPEVECIFVEEHQPEGPYGAKGVGEIALVPTASAVAGALHSFDGIRRSSLPMKDSPAARAAVPRLTVAGRAKD